MLNDLRVVPDEIDHRGFRSVGIALQLSNDTLDLRSNIALSGLLRIACSRLKMIGELPGIHIADVLTCGVCNGLRIDVAARELAENVV